MGRYHPHVDGLRALAILAVVGYHAGVPGFSGGFVGVDVFFVISGFLIVPRIVSEIRSQRFSLAGFYARRALRILPPYAIVLATVVLLARHVLATPKEFDALREQALWSSGMAVNVLFYMEQGYFDTAAKLKPLLHLWSLAVEEQFYLVVPLIVMLGYFFRKKVAAAATVLLIATSLIGCFLLTLPDSNAAFFLMPFRAWEFAAGAGAGALGTWLAERRLSAIVLPVGFLLVGGSATLLSPDLVYPSLWPLFPVAGAVFCIAGGLARPTSTGARLLSSPPFVAVGLVSYSWYLWHWPLITFGRIFEFGQSDLPRDLIAAAVAFALAVVTYVAVERPFGLRRKAITTGWLRSAAVVSAAVGACVLSAVLTTAHLQEASASAALAIPEPLRLPARHDQKAARLSVCAYQNGALSPKCFEGAVDKGILIGDSIALNYYVAFGPAAKANMSPLALLWHSACPPLVDTEVQRHGQRYHYCEKLIKDSFPAQDQYSFAVIAAAWMSYYEGLVGYKDESGRNAYLDERLEHTLTELKRAGIRRVILLGPTPGFYRLPPECVARVHKFKLDLALCSVSRRRFEAHRRGIWTALRRLESHDVRVIDPASLFCDAERCFPVVDGVLMFADAGHLTPAGARLVRNTFHDDFLWAASSTATAEHRLSGEGISRLHERGGVRVLPEPVRP